MLWYSLEAPRWGASNEYPTYVFMEKNKKYEYFLVNEVSYLEICVWGGYFQEHGYTIFTGMVATVWCAEGGVLAVLRIIPWWSFR